MEYSSPNEDLQAIHQRELNELKSLTVHRELAVAAALDYCAEEKICPPLWVVVEAAALICDLLKREKAQKRGRTAGRISRYQQDHRDLERWDAVEEIRRIRTSVKRNAALRRAHGQTPKNSSALRHEERLIKWFRAGTFQCASMYLTGTGARVDTDAMRASYRRCNKRAGVKPFPDRYYRFDNRFLGKLGVPKLGARKPGSKFLFLYDLTP